MVVFWSRGFTKNYMSGSVDVFRRDSGTQTDLSHNVESLSLHGILSSLIRFSLSHVVTNHEYATTE
tara:strand:- start:87 stop:284 length:198 start_codon:yes stop_codon:yes gene_type:complete